MKFYQDPEELQAIYEGLSEHEHQRELFSWRAAAVQFGILAANLWASLHPQTLSRPKHYWSDKPALPADTEANHPLRWLYATPNGGSRGSNARDRAREGSRMRSEGVVRGIPDIFLPMPKKGLSGLYIELKKLKGGRLSAEQEEFLAYGRQVGYCCVVCNGYREAIIAIEDYLFGPK